MSTGGRPLRTRGRLRVVLGVGAPIALLATWAVVDTTVRAPEAAATAPAAYSVPAHRHDVPEKQATRRSDRAAQRREPAATAPEQQSGAPTPESPRRVSAGQPSGSPRAAGPRIADAGSPAPRSGPPTPGTAGSVGAARPAPSPAPAPAPAPSPAPQSGRGGQPAPASTDVTSATGGTGPLAGPGRWSQVFDDEFNGTSLDRTRWSDMDGGHMNDVTTRAANVSVAGGNLVLTLSSANEGAEVSSSPGDGAGANGYLLQVGDYASARIEFPGDGRTLYNWPAWWSSGPNWPAAGENDIAEILDGALTVNYHSPSGAHNQGAVPGYWGGAYHEYGLHLQRGHADVYWDGRLVKSYPTDDTGQGQSLLVNIGRGGTAVTGAASQVKVDWVRAYRPAP